MGLEELPLVSMGQARYVIRSLQHKISELRKTCIDTIQIIENSDKDGVNIEWENKEKIKKNLSEALDNTL